MLVLKIKRFDPPKKGPLNTSALLLSQREAKFDAPGGDLRMARLKVNSECGVSRCLEQPKWVASGAGIDDSRER